MITSVQESPAPPPAVLAALRAHAGEWRESHLPESLRRRGVLAVTAEIRGRSCVVAYDWPGRGPDHPLLPLRLVATVEDRADGGSRVRIRCEYRSMIPAITLMCALIAVTPVLVFGPGAWPAPIVAVAGWTVWALLERGTRRGPTRPNDPEAAYLVERVEAVVAELGPSPLSSGSMPAGHAPAT